MPIKKTTVAGKPAVKFGEHGKAYTGPQAKANAEKQMRAMFANGYKGDKKK